MNDRQNIVMLSMSRFADWKSGIVNRNHFLFREMLASEKIGTVVLVDFLPHSFRRAVKVLLKDVHGSKLGTVIYQRPWIRIQRIDEKTIHIATVLTPWFERPFVSFLASFLKRQSIDAPILWSYLPTFVKAFSMPWKLKIFDAVDDWTAHPAYQQQKKRLKENYTTIAKSADHIFLVSDTLRTLFPERETRTVPNGVDGALFASIRNERANPPIMTYVGTVQERFDVALMTAIATARPQYVFEIVGPVWKEVDVTPLERLPNVKLLGRKPQHELPALLARSTAGIVPHRQDALVASMNPMKIYDYLSAGIPVVSTPVHGFERFGDSVAIAGDAEAFCAALDRFVAHPHDPGDIRAKVAHDDWHARWADLWADVEGALRRRS